MFTLFKKRYWPDLYIEEIEELNWADYYASGFRLLLCDLDNTLQPHGSAALTPAAQETLRKVLDSGLMVAIISNAKTKRAERLQADLRAKGLKIKVYGLAQKPNPKKLIQAAYDCQQPRQACLMLGDQVFTDIRAGKRAGLFSVLIKAQTLDEPWYIRIKRVGEKIVLAGFKR